jgi:pimeloyl-ACP methyl ester carboxylesterase
MKIIILFIIIIYSHLNVFSQHEKITDDWATISINDKNLGTIKYHIHKNKINTKKPLIVYLEGSGNFPLYWLNPNGRYSTSTTLNFKELSNDYHIILISKPNTPFVDSISIAPSGRKYYPVNNEFRQRYSLDWRTDSASNVINHILSQNNLEVDKTKIIVWGHSEGSQVAPAVAVRNESVTHVVSMMSNSLNQFYDFIINQRLLAEKGELSNEKAQKSIDSLYTEYEKIFDDPKAVDKEWFGETYYKWSSFALNPPLENMLKLDIPILYIAGGADDNQNIINMDYAKLEFLRKGKTNLTYKVYPKYDHYFMETKTDSSGKKEWIDHLGEVNDFVLNWIDKND